MATDEGMDAVLPLVVLPSGKIVPAIRTDLDPEEHTPGYLLKWIERFGTSSGAPDRVLDFKRKLCSDPRMPAFWDWLGSSRFNRLDRFRSSHTVSDQIFRSTRLPGKPGDMTPAQRDAYFAKVRTHANALRALLEGTRFDYPHTTEVRVTKLDRSLDDALTSWGVDEPDEGHVVAFQVTPEGTFQHHYDFPKNVLTETLFEVIAWSYWDDHWDGGVFCTSAPIVQMRSESTPAIYFCCTLHDWFGRYGVEIPFPILATVANVALDLPAEKQLDEDTVRKQVRRYQDRQAKRRADHPEAFDEPVGQNSIDDADSVLLDPF